MRVVLVLTLALVVVPAATSGAEPPLDGEDCAPGEAQLVVERFVRVFNARNIPALDRVFARTPNFNWYSTGAPGSRQGRAAYDRSTLIRYFRVRHRNGEKLRLVRFQGGGNANGYSHFQFLLERRSNTLAPTIYEGKGAAICARSSNTISVWSVGSRVGS